MSPKRLGAGLGPEHIAGLIAIYAAGNGSIKARVPEPAIRKKLHKPYRELCSEILKDLKKHPDGLVYVRRGKSLSYGITMNGIKFLQQKGIPLR